MITVGEDACLRQIHLDELYGAIDNKKAEEDKKKLVRLCYVIITSFLFIGRVACNQTDY